MDEEREGELGGNPMVMGRGMAALHSRSIF